MTIVTLSRKGAAFTGAWEGFRSEPYNDSQNNATVGIGHLIHLGPVTAKDRAFWGTISYQHALTLCQADAHRNGIVPLEETLKVALTQPQIDALLDLGFNAGPGSLAAGHAVMAAVNSKPHRWNLLAMRQWRGRVAAAFMEWANPVELTRRCESRGVLFARGAYTKPANPYANG